METTIAPGERQSDGAFHEQFAYNVRQKNHYSDCDMAMSQDITREQLHAYLDDALSDAEIARIERCLRDSEALQNRLRLVMQERDRGEHSIGAIWRRQRLSCLSREQLGSYMLEVLESELMDYVRFHLETIACPFCIANSTDLKTQQEAAASEVQKRRKRYFQSSAGYLQNCGDAPK